MTDNHPAILVVDDDADTCANLRDILELDDYRVETANSLGEALAREDGAGFIALVLDRRLPDGTVEDFLPQLRQMAPDAAILIVTAYSDLQAVISAMRQGATDYILKPINPDALRASLARVAERRRLAAEKERTEAMFRTLVESAPCLIFILRRDGQLLYLNSFAEHTTGHQSAETGQDFLTLLVPEEDQLQMREVLNRASTGTPTRGVEGRLRCRDHSIRWMVWNFEPLPEYDGGPALLAVGQDITSIKQAQEHALQAERLAAIGQMVTGLAHESGNALARSQACLEMLSLEVQDRPEALDLLTRIQKAQDHLKQLYDDVRNYAAPIRLEQDAFDVRSIWRQAWTNLALARQNRQAELREQVEGVDRTAFVDLFRLEQVFRNIFENSLAACKDPVVITVTCADTTLGERKALEIRVRDNGPGLAAEQQRRIFDPFFTTKTKGTGLGMAIAKRILEAHGGQITASVGPGAEIRMILPREQP